MPNDEYFVQNAVVSHLKRKDSENGFTVTPIGPELKYVGAQCNSGLHNLEEQLVLGSATKQVMSGPGIVNPETGHRTDFEIIEFKPTESTTQNYYFLSRSTERDLSLSFDTNSNKLTIDLNPKIYETSEMVFYIFDKEAEDPDAQSKEVLGRAAQYTYPYPDDPDAYSANQMIAYGPFPDDEPEP